MTSSPAPFRIAFALAVLLASCSPSLRDAAKPLPEPTSVQRNQELPNGSYRVWPASAQVQEGVAYRFDLYTHCGIDNSAIDFDGSMWDYEGEPVTRGPEGELDDPFDEGVIRLVGENEAEFTSTRGTVVDLTRRSGPDVVPGCG